MSVLSMPCAAFRVESDMDGLRTALREIFEESYLQDSCAPVFERGNREDIQRLEDDLPQRTLSPGYYTRATYLLGMATAIECGVTYPADTLTHAEVLGLDMVRRAKNMFEGDHPPCPGCGKRLDSRHMTQCPHCRTKFAGKGN